MTNESEEDDLQLSWPMKYIVIGAQLVMGPAKSKRQIDDLVFLEKG